MTRMEIHAMREQLVQLGGGAHVLAIQILGNVDDAADAVHDVRDDGQCRRYRRGCLIFSVILGGGTGGPADTGDKHPDQHR